MFGFSREEVPSVEDVLPSVSWENSLFSGTEGKNGEAEHENGSASSAGEELPREVLADVVESTSDFVSVRDGAKNPVYRNKTAREVIRSRTDGNPEDYTPGDFHPEWAREKVENEGIYAARSQGRWEGETAVLNGDGEEVPVSEVITAHRDDAGELRYLSRILRDVSGRAFTEGEREENGKRENDVMNRHKDQKEILEEFNQITTDSELAVEGKIDRLLELGCRTLELSIGFVTDVDGDELNVLRVRGDHEELEQGATIPLEDSYCRRTVEQDDLLGFTDAAQENHGGDPAPIKSNLSAYLGGRIQIEDEFRGTVCFADTSVREEPFSEEERTFVDLIRRWIRDAFSRKHHQEALENREETYRSLIENVPGVVYRCENNENWTMRFLSEGFQELSGYSPDDFVDDRDRSFQSLIHPDDRAEVQESVARGIENGEGFEVEYRIRHRDGSVRWVLERGEAVREEGAVRFLQGVIIDVTDRRKMRERLSESEEKFQQFMKNMNQVFWLTDAEKTDILYVNPAYEEIWGRSVENLYENPDQFLDAVDPRDTDRVRDQLDQQKDGEYDVQYRIERPDGEIRWIHDRAFPVRNDDGELYRIAGIAEDITERKTMQEELQQAEKLAGLGEMAAGMMHEINNPNTFVQGNARLLQDQWPELSETLREELPDDHEVLREFDDFGEMIDSIHAGSKRIESIVEKVEVFAQRRTPLERQHRNDPLEASRNALRELEPVTPESVDVNFETEGVDSGACEVLAESGEIEQVLTNLLRNAVQAVDDEDGRVRLKLEQEVDSVLFTVRDNGPGIPEKELSKIFDPFFSTKPTAKGTGLGLSIVDGIVKGLDGSLTVDTEEGVYTEFQVEVPCASDSNSSEGLSHNE